MSIIEEAVRKNAERQNRQAATDPPRGQARLRRVPTAPVDTSHAQRFQPVTLDKAVLHDNFVLPQLQDAGALRAYKILRTRVLRRLEANQWRSFALTGVTAGEGKTLTAINLAIALAQDVNTWVALVDLDLQRPRVAEYLGLRSTHGEKGLSDYLQGDATFENIVYAPSDIERLAIIPNFTPLLNASETLTSPRMGASFQGSFVSTVFQSMWDAGDVRPFLSRSARTSFGERSKRPANSTSLKPMAATFCSVPGRSSFIRPRTE